MNAFKALFILASYLFINPLFSQQPSLRINEVSQGSGEKEYVEFIVVGTPSTLCNSQTLDLRGWIFDDNNGRFKAGSGTGIANGSMRFSTANFWQAVPVGTIILLYNDADFNSSIIPAQDASLTDGNCRLVLPISSTLLEKNSLPNQTSSVYPTTGWSTGGDWSFIGMANSNDSFQIYAPSNTTTPVHAVSWGNNTANNIIYFSGSAGSKVFSAMNTVSNDLSIQSNWESKLADENNQTPGAPNSPQNAAYISFLNNNCSIPSGGISVSVASTNVTCNETCNGTASLTISGGTAPYTILWSTNETSNAIQNLCPGTYTVTVTDALNCEEIESVTIGTDATFTLTTSGDITICEGESTTISANGATDYSWSMNLGTGNSHTVTPSSTTTYSVTGTTNGCSVTENIVLTVNPSPVIDAGLDQLICIGESYTFDATGADSYVWSDGFNNGDSFIPEIGVYTYSVIGMNGTCAGTDQVQITVNTCDWELEIPNVFTPNGDLVNDVFQPTKQTNVLVKEMTVFNRWGNIVFSSEGPTFSWDGKTKDGNEVLPGVYFYQLTFQNTLQEEKIEQGYVHLMR